MLKYALIGFGGIGKVHLNAYYDMKAKYNYDATLTCICDIDKEQFEKEVEINTGKEKLSADMSKFHLYTDIDELLANEEIDLAVVALPTYLHDTVSIKLMENGINVLCEKPMALNSDRCKKMIECAKKNKVRLQIGQCCRYDAAKNYIKEIFESGKYGKILRGEFSRYSKTPDWSWQNWFLDYDKSGGSVLDLHIHDVDACAYIFGKPEKVSSYAGHAKYKFESISTNFIYDGFYVTCISDWSLAPSYPFAVKLSANFENATLELCDDGLYEYNAKGETEKIELEDRNLYAEELADFIQCILNDCDSKVLTPESAMLSVMMTEAEKKSADTNEYTTV